MLLGLSGCSKSKSSDDNTTQPPQENPSNQPPKAVANATQTSGYEGVVIEFNARGSEDPDGSIEKYHWFENGSTVSQVPYFQRKYNKAGTYKLYLEVTDNDGATAKSNILTITIKASATPPPPTCGSSAGFNIGKYATAQKTQYHVNDDGDLQRGLARAYTRDNTKETVCDTTTHLMWQDNAEAKTVTKTWDDAKTYCANLTLGGYSDWRLPSINELLSITDLERFNPAIDPTFQNVVSNYYWSSTMHASSTSDAWVVGFNDGDGDWDGKTGTYYVRCVRDN